MFGNDNGEPKAKLHFLQTSLVIVPKNINKQMNLHREARNCESRMLSTRHTFLWVKILLFYNIITFQFHSLSPTFSYILDPL